MTLKRYYLLLLATLDDDRKRESDEFETPAENGSKKYTL